MANRFDNVAKALATGMPRRKALKILVGGAAVAATTTVANKDSVALAEPTTNYTLPKRHRPTFNLPLPSFAIPGINQANPPVINIPIPYIPSPDVNQTIPPVVVPPKLDLLPRLFPQINWNFIPFNPVRRK